MPARKWPARPPGLGAQAGAVFSLTGQAAFL